uniref:G protein-coupled receptor n=1 Tax=Panagrellus redivivus TaxID=6233 RepID=A0A7E5A1J2_PANRE
MPDGTEYFQVSPEFPHQNILKAVYIFGLVVDILTIIHVGIILKLFSQITVVHKHLKIWLMATWFSIHVIFFQQYLDVVYPYLASNVLMFICFGTYFAFYFSERKKESRQAYVSSLSERYQRAENKASYKTMLRFAISGTLIIIIAVGHNMILMNVLPYKFEYVTLNDRRAFFRVCAINLLSVIILLLPSHFAYLNANMKTRYNAIFRSVWRRKPSIESSISNVHVQIKSLTGQNMVIPNETAYYFQALENQWGKKYCPEK